MTTTLSSTELANKLSSYLTAEERQIVKSAGYGKRSGLGERPALLVVDVTYGFCGRTPKPILQSIAEQRRSCGEEAWEAVARIAEILPHARRAKIPIIYSGMEDPESPEYEPGLWAQKNSRGSEDRDAAKDETRSEYKIVAEIAPQPHERVFAKNKASLFHGTGLLPYLVANKIDSLIICGGTTSGCVYATAVDAFSNNYKLAVVADASFDRLQTAHWVFLFDIDLKYGDAVTSENVIDYFRKRSS